MSRPGASLWPGRARRSRDHLATDLVRSKLPLSVLVSPHKLSESNRGCHFVTTVLYSERVKIVSSVILQRSFFGAVDDTLSETSGHLILASNHIPACCFATRCGGEMEDGPGGGREGGRQRVSAGVKQGRKEETRQRGRTRKRRMDAKQGGGRKRGSAFRTKLKSR